MTTPQAHPFLIKSSEAGPLYFHIARDMPKIQVKDGYAPWGHKNLYQHSANMEQLSDLNATVDMHHHGNKPEKMHQLCWTSSWLYALVYGQFETYYRLRNGGEHILIAYGPALVANLDANGGHFFHLGSLYNNHPFRNAKSGPKYEEWQRIANNAQEYRSTGHIGAQAVAIETQIEGMYAGTSPNSDMRIFLYELNDNVMKIMKVAIETNTISLGSEKSMKDVAVYCMNWCRTHKADTFDSLVDMLCRTPAGKSISPQAQLVHGMMKNFVHEWHGDLKRIAEMKISEDEKIKLALEFSIPTWSSCHKFVPVK